MGSLAPTQSTTYHTLQPEIGETTSRNRAYCRPRRTKSPVTAPPQAMCALRVSISRMGGNRERLCGCATGACGTAKGAVLPQYKLYTCRHSAA